MTSTQTVDSTQTIQVDARGLSCPLPIVKAAQWARQAQSGDVMELLATDAGSLKDVPAWCRITGNQLIDQQVDVGTYRFLVQRT